ncbi:MAG: patatin-like phospholipase family protein [Fimbriiglobus sp.]
MLAPPTPVEANIAPREIVDPTSEAESCEIFDAAMLYRIAEQIRMERRPANPPPKRSVLVLSGGGAYGAYSAGVLVGWTKTGQRPQFDTVTGISTGALIAPLAFLGPEYDGQLQEFYTQIRRSDLFRIKKSLRTLFSESIADNSRLVDRIEETVTPALMQAIAVEHAKGRRLYVGTTELDGRRQVIWDLGAMATRGRPEDLKLFRDVVLASAAIPGFFPPVRIPVEIDGQVYEERHVDGGVTASLFFRPPYIPPERRNDPSFSSLHDTDLYIIVAGKLYPDPEPVRPRALSIAGTGVSTLLYAGGRGDLMRLYTACIVTGMNYYMSAIPADFPLTMGSTDFEPEPMRQLFELGERSAQMQNPWRRTPPGLEPNEDVSLRGGNILTRIDNQGLPSKAAVSSRLNPFLWNPYPSVRIRPQQIEK